MYQSKSLNSIGMYQSKFLVSIGMYQSKRCDDSPDKGSHQDVKNSPQKGEFKCERDRFQ